jgi:hypothetical protein
VGSWRGETEDEQFPAAGGAGFRACEEVQPAAVTIVSNINAMHRRIRQAYAVGLRQSRCHPGLTRYAGVTSWSGLEEKEIAVDIG